MEALWLLFKDTRSGKEVSPPFKPVWTFAVLQIGEEAAKSDASWLRRFFGIVAPKPPQEDFNCRLNSAAGVVVQMIIHDACDNIGKPTLAAQFNEIPKGFHIIVTFGMCLIMGIAFLCREEGHTIDVKTGGVFLIGGLLLMRSPQEQNEQYQLGHTLLMKFAKAGGEFTEWQNKVNQFLRMYLLASNDKRLQKYDYPSLFGSMLKTLISAVELPD
jgi:hypothetical protein